MRAWLAGMSLVAGPVAPDAGASTGIAAPDPGDIAVRFDPVTRETQVRDRVGAGLCVSFRLAQEWKGPDGGGSILTASSGEDLELRLRPGSGWQDLPRAERVAREAAGLQRSYEDLIGKPAQSVTHQETGLPGVSRWSATWVDGNLADPGHALTVETFIVDLRGGAALELTMSAEDGEAYRREVGRLLSSLQVTSGGECQ